MDNEPQPSIETLGDVLFSKKLIGLYLWWCRLNSKLSLRELERASGVFDSEIAKVEAGEQACRLESFVRLCTSLGVSCGEVIDQATWGNPVVYHRRIMELPKRPKQFSYFNDDEVLYWNLAVFSSYCVHLIRCSRPVDLATMVEYPHESLRSAFIEFAQSMADLLTEAERRRSLFRLFRDDPILGLMGWKLCDQDILQPTLTVLTQKTYLQKGDFPAAILESIGIPPKIPIWFPYVWHQDAGLPKPQLVSDISKKDLPYVTVYDNNLTVKAKLPALIKRLKEATKERGTKTALAKFIGVPLPKISQWLSSEYEPGGETTLRLLQWVEQQERQKQKSPGCY